MKVLKNKIMLMDIYSPEVQFKIQHGNLKYKTLIGGFLSLMTFILIGSALVYFLIEFFSRENSKIITADTMSNKITIERFDQFPFMIRMSDTYSHPLAEPEKYYKFVLSYWHYKVNETDPNKAMSQHDFWIEKIPCDIENPTHINPKYKELFSNYTDINTFFCPNHLPEGGDIIGLYGDSEPWSDFHLYLRKCINELDNNICASQNDLDEYFSNSYIDYRILNFNILPLNNIPFAPFISGDRFSVSHTVYRRMWVYLKTIYFTSDWGYVFEEKKTEKFYILDTIKNDIDLRDTSSMEIPYSFFTMSLLNSKSYVTYIRSYMKAQEFLANVGGIIKGISVIAMILNYIVGYRLYYLHLINHFPDVLNETAIEFSAENKNELFKAFNIKKVENPEKSGVSINLFNSQNKNSIIDFNQFSNFHNSNYRNLQNHNILNLNPNQIENSLGNINNLNSKNQNSDINLSNNNLNQNKENRKLSNSKVNYQLPKYLQNTFQIKLSWWQYLFPKFLYCCKSMRFSIYEKAYNNLQEELEITSVLNKLNQFEKLKNGILNDDQLTLFNYIFQTPHFSNNEKNRKYTHKIDYSNFLSAKEKLLIKKEKNNLDEYLLTYLE